MSKAISLVLSLLVLLAAAPFAGAQPAEKPGPPVSLKGPGEDATFYLYVNEDRIGTLRAEWQPDGSYRNEATLAMAGQSLTIVTTIAVDADGIWTYMTAAATTGETVTVRDGANASRTLKEKTTTFTVKP